MTLTLRALTYDDLLSGPARVQTRWMKELMELEGAAFPGINPYHIKVAVNYAMHNAEKNRLWALTAYAKPVGVIYLALPGSALYQSRLESDAVYVAILAVHPSRQRRGLARRLMQEAFGLAREKDIQFVTLHVRDGTSAVDFYRHIGGREVAYFKDYYEKDVHARQFIWPVV